MQTDAIGELDKKSKSLRAPENVAKNISDELLRGANLTEELVKNEMAGNKDIFGIRVAYAPYRYSGDCRLYAPYYMKTDSGIELIYVENSYDYTLYNNKTALYFKNGRLPDTSWYNRPLKEGKGWNSFRFETAFEKWVIDYSCPFSFNNTGSPDSATSQVNQSVQEGVVWAGFTLEGISERINNSLDPGKNGSLIICKDSFQIYPEDQIENKFLVFSEHAVNASRLEYTVSCDDCNGTIMNDVLGLLEEDPEFSNYTQNNISGLSVKKIVLRDLNGSTEHNIIAEPENKGVTLKYATFKNLSWDSDTDSISCDIVVVNEEEFVLPVERKNTTLNHTAAGTGDYLVENLSWNLENDSISYDILVANGEQTVFPGVLKNATLKHTAAGIGDHRVENLSWNPENNSISYDIVTVSEKQTVFPGVLKNATLNRSSYIKFNVPSPEKNCSMGIVIREEEFFKAPEMGFAASAANKTLRAYFNEAENISSNFTEWVRNKPDDVKVEDELKFRKNNSNVSWLALAFKSDDNGTRSLYAPCAMNDTEFQIIQIQSIYDYTEDYHEDEPSAALYPTEWYYKALNRKNGTWTEVCFSEIVNKSLVSYSLPFNCSNISEWECPDGVVAVDFSVDTLRDNFSEINTENTGYAFIIHRDGTLVSYPTHEYIGDNMSSLSIKDPDMLVINEILFNESKADSSDDYSGGQGREPESKQFKNLIPNFQEITASGITETNASCFVKNEGTDALKVYIVNKAYPENNLTLIEGTEHLLEEEITGKGADDFKIYKISNSYSDKNLTLVEVNDYFLNEKYHTYYIFLNASTGDNWKTGLLISEEEILKSLREKQTHDRILESLAFLSFIFFATLAICLKYGLFSGRFLWAFTVFFFMLFVAEMGFIWCLALECPQEDSNETVIYNRAEMESAVHRLGPFSEESRIPTGIFLQSIKFSGANDVIVRGYVWQKKPENPENPVNGERGTAPGVIFPEAESIDLKEAYRNEDVTGWRFKAVLRQSFDYSNYPFDNEDISIRLWNNNSEGNVILVPDLGSYESLNPYIKPGLDTELMINGWEVQKSYFSYREKKYNTNFGMKSYEEGKTPELYYNVEVKRNLMGPLVADVSPILVVAILLFVVLMITTKSEQKKLFGFSSSGVLGYCASLLFTLIIAHASLRSKLPAEGIIYLEYFYFVMYIAILAVSVNSILFASRSNIPVVDYKDNLIIKLLYLPLIALVIMLITLGVFY